MSERRVYDQACDWIVRLESDTVTAAERSEFVRWLNRDGEHARAYEEMSRLWARMDTLSLARAGAFTETAESARNSPAPWYLGYRGAVAASLAIISLIIATVVFTDPVRDFQGGRQFVTPIDQEYEFTAPDGSRVRLGPRTTATLHFTRQRRGMELAEGELEVTVRHDPRRPFTVRVGDYVAEAVGTRFVLRRSQDHIGLRVIEGAVRFYADPMQEAQAPAGQQPKPDDSVSLQLDAGQHLTWSSGTREILLNDPADTATGGQ